jgi:hypothetical protein
MRVDVKSIVVEGFVGNHEAGPARIESGVVLIGSTNDSN